MRSRYHFLELEGDFPYFVTATTVEWIPIFTEEKYFEIIKKSLEFCEKKEKFKVHAYVIMDNHLHLIISGKNLASAVRDFKSFTAKEIIEAIQSDNKEWLLNQLEFFKKRYKVKSVYQVWQEGVHPQMIENERVFAQKVEYIHANPVRRGYVQKPEDWVYSSAKIWQSEAFESLVFPS